jgi:dUTPase
MPIYVRVVDSINELGPETSRGEGGFGSTGVGI